MKNYPTLPDVESSFSDKDLCDMAIEARMLLTKLGETATKRMMYIGFDLVYPFDNSLDWYTWTNKVQTHKVSHEEYSTMEIRGHKH